MADEEEQQEKKQKKAEKAGVLVLGPFFPDLIQAIDSNFTLFKLWEAEDEQAFLAHNAGQIFALVGDASIGATAHLIDALPNLEMVSCFSVGTDKVDLVKCRERGIVVTNTPDVLTDDTADLAFALVLTTMRRVCAADRYIREGLWPIHAPYPLSHTVKHIRNINCYICSCFDDYLLLRLDPPYLVLFGLIVDVNG
ncbi:hypothetical protein O6H91_13G028800 [Diphasiastrum complanatum]|uniref:Uncharacterized protein n=1 Tax=Diphasiastrum complanatum TaxID=34168 RepID=A0ACC2BTI5_DIPCM|nr:hypothetical protein O6H91_13G028800 [Diphasiastrum complanatum]